MGDFFTSQDVGQAGLGALSQYAGAALSKFGLGPAGKGRMAARGQAAAAADFARLQAGVQGLQFREAEAYRAFEATGGTVGMPVTFNPDPKVQKLGKAIVAVKQAIELNTKVRKEKKLLQKERELEKKLAKRELRTAPITEVRVTDIYGPNAGYWRERGAPPPLWLVQGRH